MILDPDYRKFMSPYFIINQIMGCGVTHLVILLSVLANSFKEKKKSQLQWVIITIIVFLLVEIDIIFRESIAHDIIDTIYPYLTIAERLEILKISLLPFIHIVKYYFRIFVPHTHDEILVKSNYLIALNVAIANHLKDKQVS